MVKISKISLAALIVFCSSAAIAEYQGDISAQKAFERTSMEANVYILDVRTGQEWIRAHYTSQQPGSGNRERQVSDRNRKYVNFLYKI
jgi:hypothetical protein